MTSSKTVLPWVPWRTSDVVRGVALVGGAALLILSIALALDLRPGVATILIAALDGTMIMAVFIFGVRRYRVPWSIAGLRVPRRPSTALLLPWLVLLMSLTLSALYGVAARYGGWESLEPSTLPADTLGSGMLKVITMLVLTLWVPMSEELFFRGFLLTGLLHRMGPSRRHCCQLAPLRGGSWLSGCPDSNLNRWGATELALSQDQVAGALFHGLQLPKHYRGKLFGVMQIMAGRIQQEFNRIRASGRKALIPYLTVGFPDLETTVSLVETVVEAGADLVELGVPFSDPLADGVTIQRSTLHALRSGVTLDDCLAVVRKLRSRGVRIPIILMGYYNPILHYGLEEFTQAALQSEVDGLIVVDLPTEESWPLREACREKRISMIPLLAPTSTDERIAAACQHAEGFIYCVSLTGVTGARGELTSGVPELVRPRTSAYRSTRGCGVWRIQKGARGSHRDLRRRSGGGKRYHRRAGAGAARWHAESGQGVRSTTERFEAPRREEPAMSKVRGIRGATTADANTKKAILGATRELLEEMVKINEIEVDDVAATIFTTTEDLNAEFPALAARQMGWNGVALMCGHEMRVPDALPSCIRVLLLVNTRQGRLGSCEAPI